MNITKLRKRYQTHLINFIAANLATTGSFDELSSKDFSEIVFITYKHYVSSQYDMTVDGLARIVAWMFKDGLDFRSLFKVEKIWDED